MLCSVCEKQTAVNGSALCADCAAAEAAPLPGEPRDGAAAAAPEEAPAGTADGVPAGEATGAPAGEAAPAPGLPLAPPLTRIPAPAREIRVPVVLGQAVVVLLAVNAVLDVFLLLAGALTHSAADWDAADRARRMWDWGVSIQGLAMLACGIVFVVWLTKVRRNAESFDPDGHRHSAGWCFWGWIAPIVNFWYPRRIVLDIWVASAPAGPDRKRSSGLVNLWWGTWLVATLLALPQSGPDDSLPLAVAYTVLDAAAAVLATLIVRRLTAMQQERAAAGPDRMPVL